MSLFMMLFFSSSSSSSTVGSQCLFPSQQASQLVLHFHLHEELILRGGSALHHHHICISDSPPIFTVIFSCFRVSSGPSVKKLLFSESCCCLIVFDRTTATALWNRRFTRMESLKARDWFTDLLVVTNARSSLLSSFRLRIEMPTSPLTLPAKGCPLEKKGKR